MFFSTVVSTLILISLVKLFFCGYLRETREKAVECSKKKLGISWPRCTFFRNMSRIVFFLFPQLTGNRGKRLFPLSLSRGKLCRFPEDNDLMVALNRRFIFISKKKTLLQKWHQIEENFIMRSSDAPDRSFVKFFIGQTDICIYVRRHIYATISFSWLLVSISVTRVTSRWSRSLHHFMQLWNTFPCAIPPHFVSSPFSSFSFLLVLFNFWTLELSRISLGQNLDKAMTIFLSV